MSEPIEFIMAFNGSTLNEGTEPWEPIIIGNDKKELIIHGYCGIVIARNPCGHLQTAFYRPDEYIEFARDVEGIKGDNEAQLIYNFWSVSGGYSEN